jgi:hypothetical protein
VIAARPCADRRLARRYSGGPLDLDRRAHARVARSCDAARVLSSNPSGSSRARALLEVEARRHALQAALGEGDARHDVDDVDVIDRALALHAAEAVADSLSGPRGTG